MYVLSNNNNNHDDDDDDDDDDRKLVLWLVVVLEQAGGLHGIIRWFKLILRVFFILLNCDWVLLIYM